MLKTMMKIGDIQRMDSRKAQRGFTMIEIIAVLIIISVIMAVVVARMSTPDQFSARSQAESIKSHIRYAQSQAINSNVIWGIYFIDGSRYALFKDGNTGVTVQISGADSNPVDLSAKGVVVSNLGAGIVSFDSWGTPYTDAAANTVQTGTRTLTVTAGGAGATIQITPNTGYIP
jgi:MSHA pilin protein MshC